MLLLPLLPLLLPLMCDWLLYPDMVSGVEGGLVEDREVGIGVQKLEFKVPRDIQVKACCSTEIVEDKCPFIYSLGSLE